MALYHSKKEVINAEINKRKTRRRKLLNAVQHLHFSPKTIILTLLYVQYQCYVRVRLNTLKAKRHSFYDIASTRISTYRVCLWSLKHKTGQNQTHLERNCEFICLSYVFLLKYFLLSYNLFIGFDVYYITSSLKKAEREIFSISTCKNLYVFCSSVNHSKFVGSK